MTAYSTSTGVQRVRRRLGAEERREQLESAAIEVVAEVGFGAAGADLIAARAEVSKGLLWHYFDSLDELLAAAARRAFSRLEAAVAGSVDPDAPVPDLLRSALRRAATLPRTHPADVRALREIVTNLRTPDGTARLGEEEYDRLYAAQAALFRRGQAAGQLRAELDPELLAVTYQGLVDRMVDHLAAHPDRDPEAAADQVAGVLLGGITAAP